MFPFITILALGSQVAQAAPLSSRQALTPDLTVVKFAALAELLESTFYTQALERFTAQDFEAAGYVDGQLLIDQLTVIRDDETTHLTTLRSVATTLGGSTSDLDSCQFDFSSAMTDVTSFLATARVLEFVGVDAYIGGATLIEDKSLLVSAAEILTVEARHNTVLNTFNGGSSIPNAFDMVLTPQQVLSVAAPFISGGCDPVAALGLTPLTLTNTDLITAGTLLTFGGAGLEGQDASAMFCSVITGGAAEGLSFPIGECKVPEGIDGLAHVFIVNSATPLAANIITQDATAIVAGPIVMFIDTLPNKQAELLKGQGRADGGGQGWSLDLSPLIANGPGKVVLVTEVTIE